MSHQYSRILTENKNLKALCVEVQDLVCKLDLDPQVEPVLLHSPLTSASNIRDCTNACATLQEAVNQELSQGVSILQVSSDGSKLICLAIHDPHALPLPPLSFQAVTEQKQSFSTLSFTFGRRLYTHLSQSFVQQVGILTQLELVAANFLVIFEKSSSYNLTLHVPYSN